MEILNGFTKEADGVGMDCRSDHRDYFRLDRKLGRDRTIIVGQAPARETVGKPAFSGKSGPRFADLLGVAHPDLWDVFEVFNLLNHFPGDPKDRTKRGDAFPLIAAKMEAVKIRESLQGRIVVLVGKNVQRAFGLTGGFFEWRTAFATCEFSSAFDYCTVPHPSGVSFFWNDPQNVKSAREFMRTIPR